MDQRGVGEGGLAATEARLRRVQSGPPRSIEVVGQEEPLEDLAVHADQSDGSEIVHVPRLVDIFGEEMDVGEVPGSWSSAGTEAEIEQAAQETREGREQEGLEEAHMDTVTATGFVGILVGDLPHHIRFGEWGRLCRREDGIVIHKHLVRSVSLGEGSCNLGDGIDPFPSSFRRGQYRAVLLGIHCRRLVEQDAHSRVWKMSRRRP